MLSETNFFYNIWVTCLYATMLGLLLHFLFLARTLYIVNKNRCEKKSESENLHLFSWAKSENLELLNNIVTSEIPIEDEKLKRAVTQNKLIMKTVRVIIGVGVLAWFGMLLQIYI